MIPPFNSPLTAFYHWEKQSPDNVFLRQPLNGKWLSYTFRQAGDEARRITTTLKAFDLPPGSSIAILSKNCAHSIIADLAIWMSGHISVPIYPSLSAEGIEFILKHSESKAIFIGKLDDYPKQRSGIAESIHRITFPFYGPQEGHFWDIGLKAEPFLENIAPDPSAIASIMYSSGTTGSPKGIMLPFKAFDFVGTSIIQNLGLIQTERFFSYLPLSHIAEKAYVEMGVLYSGGSVSFTESLEKFAANLQEVQPTAFGGVPRIFAKFQEGILAKFSQQKLDRLLAVPILSTVLKRILRKKLGLGKAKIIICGAAPTPVSLLTWFNKLGIQIHEIYGMTENCGYSHGDHGKTLHVGTVGRPWNRVECNLTDEGEILTKHPGLMTGYFKDPDATVRVFTPDGFLKTGDKGSIDNEGYLTIIGRVKDQFKTDKGKFVAPAPIEMKLSANSHFEQVCVVGTGVPQPIALAVLSTAAKLKSREDIQLSLETTLATVNLSLERHERLNKIVILNEEWTIENGLMTPSLKIKRYEIEKMHLEKYPQWYALKGEVIWD